MERMISEGHLRDLLNSEAKKGTRVVGPVHLDSGDFYLPVEDAAALNLTPSSKPPERSLKEFIFPCSEDLLGYVVSKDGVMVHTPAEPKPTLIVGARPCDVRAFLALDKLFAWDYDDELYQARRKAATLVSMACPGGDADCFCTLLGSSPEDRTGADLFMTPMKGGYWVEVLTEKGKSLVDAHSQLFSEAKAEERPAKTASAPQKAGPDFPRLSGWLASHFEDPVWREIGMRCLGCGACAHVCPTCHCFDIVDEPDSDVRGVRRRNWDSCQVPLFTSHASGHNPRDAQPKRMRQRIFHKFRYFPERFGVILCTGCGRCTRACPADQDLLAALETLNAMAEQPK